MKIMLKIYLMGLVALVPTTRDGGLTIILQNAREATMPHLPVVVWDSKVDATVTVDGIAQHDQGDEIMGRLLLTGLPPLGLILEGETISIEGTQRGVVKSIDRPRRPWYAPFRGAVPDNCNDMASTAWIPKMQRISRGASRVKREIMEDPRPGKVAGILKLAASASLSTFHVAGWKNEDRSFTFKTSLGAHPFLGHRGAMADVVLLTVPVEIPVDRSNPITTVTVILRQFGGGERARERRIALQLRDGAQSVDLLLGNLTPVVFPGELTPEADHFSLYYELTDRRANLPIKIPFLGKRAAIPRVNAVIPEVIYSVSGDCNYSFAPDEKEFIEGESGSMVRRSQPLPGPAGGGQCRPICGVPMLQEPVYR